MLTDPRLWLTVLQIIETISCFVIFLPTVYLIVQMFGHKNTHINFRILLCYTVLEYQLIVVCRVSARLMHWVDDDFFSRPIIICNVGQHWFLNQLVFSVLFLTLERTYSTLKTESYERKGCKLSVCATLIVAIFMLWMTLGMEIYKNSIPGKKPTTSVYDSQPESLINGWIMCFCPMSLAALILYKLFRYNQHQRRNYEISLTNKFHYSENIYTTKCLIPMTLIYALTLLPALPCALYLATYSPIYGHDDPRIRFVAMLPHVLYDLNAHLSVCWIIAKFPPIRQKLLSDLRRLGLSNNVVETETSVERQAAYVQATNAHFKHLQRIWS